MSIRKQYDTDLEALKAALVEMGNNSAEAVEAALEALCTADADAAKSIVKGDSRINNMERDIEHRCMTLLLRQQPVAGDLRRISTAMKVVTDIERIGDHAADIAEIIPHLVTVRKEGDPAVSQAIAMGVVKAYTSNGATLSVLLYLRAFEDGDFTSAWGIGAVLLVLVLLINLAARLAKTKLKQKQ